MISYRSLGYLGGTFDPPHLGHEMLAREALYQLNLDAVMWLITPDPPHKTDREITPVAARLKMVNLVVNRNNRFFISEADLQRPPPHYAVDTVEIIKSQQPDLELVYIIGEDSLRDLPGWYQPERFLAAIDQLAVAPRPGFRTDLEALDGKLAGIKEKTTYLTEIMVEISSSLIRQRIGSGGEYDHFLVGDVAEYIQKNHLYLD